MTDPGRGYFYSLSAAFFSGSCVGVGKIMLTDGDAQTLSLWLFVFAVPINFIWWRAHRQRDKYPPIGLKSFLLISIQAVFSVVAIVGLWSAVKIIDPTVASFLNRFEVLVAVLLGIWLFKERFKPIEAIGALGVFAGLLIIRYRADIELSHGIALVLGASFLFGISEVIAKRIVRDVEPGLFALLRNTHILIFLIILTFMRGNYHYSQLGGYFYLAPLAGLLGPGLGRPLYLHALKYLELSKVATVNQIQPIPVAILAFFSLGMIPTLKEWIGGLVIISGCIIMIRGRFMHGNRDL